MYNREKTAAGLKYLSIRFSACLVAASSLIGCALAAPATVTAQGGLRLRSDTNTSSQTITTLSSGTQVDVLEALDGWYRIETNGKTGYVSSQYLSLSGTVSASSLNLRGTPSTSGTKVASLSSGIKVEILESLDGWYRVEADGKTGYVSSQYISLAKSQPPVATTPTPPAAQDPTLTGTVSASSLNVRSGPGSSHSKVAALPSGTQVEIFETLDGWYRIEANGKTGYVSSQYVSVSQPEQSIGASAVSQPEPEPQPAPTVEQQPEAQPEAQPQPEAPPQDSKTYGMVCASTLNVRSGPGSSYEKLSSLSSGAQVEILESLDGWYRIEKGYVSAEYIILLDGSMSALQAEIVAFARTFLGCAYVYGGNGPKSFDCSGLTKYVYKHFGYNINRTATAQLKNGVTVSKENLQPGDLVFFNSTNSDINKATHVGIYIGGGQFLHASNKKLGVTITSLSDPYRLRTYTTARRII
ncbi:MAG: hypothetical protein E7440_05515 [Ruminococcaceae bacterium]|nr:hypothetical protein [Oscillospiraceae bacterium]